MWFTLKLLRWISEVNKKLYWMIFLRTVSRLVWATLIILLFTIYDIGHSITWFTQLTLSYLAAYISRWEPYKDLSLYCTRCVNSIFRFKNSAITCRSRLHAVDWLRFWSIECLSFSSKRNQYIWTIPLQKCNATTNV